MLFKKIVDLFKEHSVSVNGMKGTGKDVLMGNVIARRPEHYISNMDYTDGERRIPLDYKDLELNGNTRKNLVSGRVFKYVTPFPEGADIYISDCGIYFPSQYCNELNKEYPNIATYLALSRHLNDGRVHTNCQNLGRVYDKIREMSDIYITTNWVCKWLLKFGIVLQTVTIYDKYESAVNRVKPCKVRSPLLCLDRTAQAQIDIYRDNFYNQHGEVKKRLLLYRNKSKHDSRFFKRLFEEGEERKKLDEKTTQNTANCSPRGNPASNAIHTSR